MYRFNRRCPGYFQMQPNQFYSLSIAWLPIGWTVVLKSPNDHNWVILCIFNSLIFGVNFLLTGIRIFITAVELIKTYLWYVGHESAAFNWSDHGMKSTTMILATKFCCWLNIMLLHPMNFVTTLMQTIWTISYGPFHMVHMIWSLLKL